MAVTTAEVCSLVDYRGRVYGRDRARKVLWLSQQKYVTKILERFNMSNAKPVGSVLLTICRLNAKQCPKGQKEKAEMKTMDPTC